MNFAPREGDITKNFEFRGEIVGGGGEIPGTLVVVTSQIPVGVGY
jgi:hypothetical protein